MTKSEVIWMNGKLVPYAEATVHFLTPAMHYGLAVFEGIRCYDTTKGPAVFRLREHLQRFINSMKILGIEAVPYDLGTLRQAVHATIRANTFESCYIRPLMYMAEGGLGLNLDNLVPAVGIAVWDWGNFLGDEGLKKGIRAMVSSFTRHHPNISMTKAKISGNYVNSVMAKTLAIRAGFDEAIMLDPEGFVAECSGENIFLVRDNTIYTPPRAIVLEGITRDAIITIARDLGYRVIEELISRDQLYSADEVFVTGTAAECVGIREIDYRTVGEGAMGPVTSALQAEFFQTVIGKGERSAEWLDYVQSGESVQVA